jgi:hypothetical protein
MFCPDLGWTGTKSSNGKTIQIHSLGWQLNGHLIFLAVPLIQYESVENA